MQYCTSKELFRLKNDFAELRHYNKINDSYILYAYILYITSKRKKDLSYTDIINGKLIKDKIILSAVNEEISNKIWDNIKSLMDKHTSECFSTFALVYSRNQMQAHVLNGFSFEPETPISIIKLASRLLDIQENETVADICCGSGSFLVNECMKNNKVNYIGYEINTRYAVNSYIRSILLEGKMSINLCDVFEIMNADSKYFIGNKKFDKIFANYPFGLRLRDIGFGSKYLTTIEKKYPNISKSTSSDWFFNLLLSETLSENGKAIGIMTNGSTWNSIDASVREYFVKNDLIETIIALPGKLFPDTNILTSLIILSHKPKKGIRMIDATELCTLGRRENILNEEHINEIIKLCSEDAEKSKFVEIKTIEENDYVLNPSRYLNAGIKLKNAVKFGTIIKNITRGANCTANQLDEMDSKTKTDFQYIQLSNIKEGQIDDTLPYLKSLDEKYLKYCLKNKNLILSKNSIPYKLAIAELSENQTILASGNLYVIELDEEQANPYYIKAFLDSQKGQALLKSITVGTTIPSIGVEALKNMLIQLPDMKEQNKIAEEYQAITDEIKVLKLRVKKTLDKLNHLYDKACEG